MRMLNIPTLKQAKTKEQKKADKCRMQMESSQITFFPFGQEVGENQPGCVCLC